jgi:hypothetical protein
MLCLLMYTKKRMGLIHAVRLLRLLQVEGVSEQAAEEILGSETEEVLGGCTLH